MKKPPCTFMQGSVVKPLLHLSLQRQVLVATRIDDVFKFEKSIVTNMM